MHILIWMVLLLVSTPSMQTAAHPVILLAGQQSTDDLVSRAQARSPEVPTLNVGTLIVAEPASDTPLPIQVGPADRLPRNSFVRIRGLPHSVALTEGHAIAPGSWAVPFTGLPRLQIKVPAGLSGRSEVTVALVTVDGAVLSEVKTSLVITTISLLPANNAQPQRKSVASIGSGVATVPDGPSAQPSPPQAPRTEAQERALRFITRGHAQLRDGDAATARLFFQRAVDAGLPEGALAMAQSYDRIELERLDVRGVAGDLEMARQWYERAREMGASEAEEKLRRLGKR